MARLVLMQAGGGEKSFSLGAAAVIGRDPQNEIALDDQSASRQHCRIEQRGSAFVLIDLGSRNGTFLNGERVTEQVVREGDRIKVGASELTFTDQVRYRLEFVAGERVGDAIPLDRERVTFGRKPTNAVALDEIGVSGVHCEVVMEGGRLILRDLGSTNGTFLEGQKIDEVVLSHGDRIRIGTTELVFVDATQGAIAAAAAPRGTAATAATDAGIDAPRVLSAGPRRNRLVSLLVPVLLLLAVGAAGYLYFTRARGGALRASVPPAAGNLITQEWSFEDPELLTQYFELSGDGLKPLRPSSPGGRSGLAALAVTLEAGTRALLSVRHALDVEPEHRYLIRVHARGAASASVAVGARLPSSGGQELEWPLVSHTLADSFAPIEGTVVVPPNVRQLRPVVGAFGSGAVAIDDLEVFDRGAIGQLPQTEGFELLDSGTVFSLLQFNNLQFAGGFVELKRGAQVVSPCTVAASGSIKPDDGGKSLVGEWAVTGAADGTDVACGFVVAEGLGGGRVRILSERGAEPRDGPFEWTPCQALLLGSGSDLIQLRFAEPHPVSGKPIEGGAFALSVQPVAGKLAFHVDLSFQDRRLRAQPVERSGSADQARQVRRRACPRPEGHR
ncbi:MAG: FHA domain-containing protein [Planctomycetota bacterium]